MNMEMDSLKSALLMEIYNSLSANNTDEKILDFADVPQGWHFGEGSSMSAAAIRDASKLHEAFILNGFYETDAFPGLAGEIRVTAYYGNRYFEFTRENDGAWSYVFEIDGTVENELDCLTLEQAQEIVKASANNLWNSYDISLGSIGMRDLEGFKVSPSGPQTMEGFRLWTSFVPQSSGRCANILENFILPQESLQFFGGSQTPYYQTPQRSLNRQATQVTNAIEISSIFPARNQRIYSRNSVLNPMISKSAWERSQDASALQTCLPLD